MSEAEDDRQTAVIIDLARQAVEIRGHQGALEWVMGVMICEAKDFTQLVKKFQEAGNTSVEMTPEVISAYNELVWATALMAAILHTVQNPQGAEKSQKLN